MNQTKNADKRVRARELNDLVRTRTRDQVKAIIDIGLALLEIRNDELWHLLNYRSWQDYCERAADLSASSAAKYIDIYEAFGDVDIAEHEYVGITKLLYLRRIAINKTIIRRGLRVARDKTCEEFKTWVAKEGKRLRQAGETLRAISERHNQVNIIFDKEEKKEFREILEAIKEEDDLHLNGQAVLAMARFWKKNHRKLRRVA